MPEGKDRGLVRNPVTDHVDARKLAHGWHLDQRLFHAWIAKAVPNASSVASWVSWADQQTTAWLLGRLDEPFGLNSRIAWPAA